MRRPGSATAPSTTSDHAEAVARVVVVYLTALVGRDPRALLEIRWRHGDHMRRRVIPVGDQLAGAAALITRLGAQTDVYVGCAPRRHRAGGLQAITRTWVLWVDCDTPDAISALQAFKPAPAIVVRSGSGENRHAYWTLTGPLSGAAATAANRRLAHALRADVGAVTSAAAILRPPGTANFKHDPPSPVVAERMQPWQRVSATRLTGELPEPQQSVREEQRPALPGRRNDDPLRDIAPSVYMQQLTGLVAGRDGKLSCPFHGTDATPSLHVYETPREGWYCYGCGRGGSIYDLGAEVFGLSTRGRDFVELRRRLHAALAACTAPTPPGGGLRAADRQRRDDGQDDASC